MFNPILGAAARTNVDEDESRKAFLETVASLTDNAHAIEQSLQKLHDEHAYVAQSVVSTFGPIDEMAEREVSQNDLTKVKDTFNEIVEDVNSIEQEAGPVS